MPVLAVRTVGFSSLVRRGVCAKFPSSLSPDEAAALAAGRSLRLPRCAALGPRLGEGRCFRPDAWLPEDFCFTAAVAAAQNPCVPAFGRLAPRRFLVP